MMQAKRVILGILLLLTAGGLVAQMSANGVLYINTYKVLAMNEMQRSGIPAAVILAQGLHETEAGTSILVKQSNNHFGIKCKEEWKGEVVYHDDDSRQECFRSYPTAADSYRDHSDFLRRGTRYAFLFDLDPTDYEGWAYGLKKAGYATNIKYSQILIKLIKDYNLQQYSLIAMGKMKAEDEVVLTMPGVPSVVAVTAVGQPGGQGTGIVGGGTGGGSTDSVVSAATAEAAVSYPEGEFTINKTRVVYARGGASLLGIAGRYDIPLGRLLEFNDMREQDVLAKGQLIFLQWKRRTGAMEYHVVREGENLYDISQLEGIRLQDMLEMNQLTPGGQPALGERIYLQGSAPSRPRLAGMAGGQQDRGQAPVTTDNQR